MSTILFKELGLRPSEVKAAQARARREGVSVQEYLGSVVKKDLRVRRTLREITGPIGEDVKKSGLTEAELTSIVDRARHATSNRSRRKLR